MHYWDSCLMTIGAGCIVGAIIAPEKSWLAIVPGVVFILIGHFINKAYKE